MFKKLIRKPFKGNVSYEWQIGKFVFLLYYPHSPWKPDLEKYKFDFFIDPYWKLN